MQPYEYKCREVRRVNNRQDDEGDGLLQQLCWWQSSGNMWLYSRDPDPTEKEERMADVKIQGMFAPRSLRCKSAMSSTLHFWLFFSSVREGKYLHLPFCILLPGLGIKLTWEKLRRENQTKVQWHVHIRETQENLVTCQESQNPHLECHLQ